VLICRSILFVTEHVLS